MLKYGLLRRRKERITDAPSKVSGVSPIDQSVNLQLDTIITWARATMAQWYDVWMGDSALTLVKVSDAQVARAYIPTLTLDSTYYLRIDSGNTLGTTTGDVISFSTWDTSAIETDENGIPETDEEGKYLETSI